MRLTAAFMELTFEWCKHNKIVRHCEIYEERGRLTIDSLYGEVLSEEVTSELELKDEKGSAMQNVRWRASKCWGGWRVHDPEIGMR